MKHLVLALLTLITISSCEKRCDPSNPSIIGEWAWRKSEGGISGGTITPETAGENIKVIITRDSTYKEYLNNKLIANSEFHLAFDLNTGHPYLKFTGLMNQNLDHVDCDVLILTDRAADGYKKSYIRK